MKIIKHGDNKKENYEGITYCCPYCGCIWKSDVEDNIVDTFLYMRRYCSDMKMAFAWSKEFIPPKEFTYCPECHKEVKIVYATNEL